MIPSQTNSLSSTTSYTTTPSPSTSNTYIFIPSPTPNSLIPASEDSVLTHQGSSGSSGDGGHRHLAAIIVPFVIGGVLLLICIVILALFIAYLIHKYKKPTFVNGKYWWQIDNEL